MLTRAEYITIEKQHISAIFFNQKENTIAAKFKFKVLKEISKTYDEKGNVSQAKYLVQNVTLRASYLEELTID